MKFLNRISLSEIIKSHCSTFYDDAYLRIEGKKRVPLGDKIIFIVIPIIIAIILLTSDFFITETYLNIILTCLSIFAGLLFGLLSLVFELTKNIKKEVEIIKINPIEGDTLFKKLAHEELKYRISKELFVNIGFAIIVSILTIICAILTRLYPKQIILWLSHFECYQFIKTVYLVSSNFLAYYLLMLFVLTIMMILKRFFLLFESETKNFE